MRLTALASYQEQARFIEYELSKYPAAFVEQFAYAKHKKLTAIAVTDDDREVQVVSRIDTLQSSLEHDDVTNFFLPPDKRKRMIAEAAARVAPVMIAAKEYPDALELVAPVCLCAWHSTSYQRDMIDHIN